MTQGEAQAEMLLEVSSPPTTDDARVDPFLIVSDACTVDDAGPKEPDILNLIDMPEGETETAEETNDGGGPLDASPMDTATMPPLSQPAAADTDTEQVQDLLAFDVFTNEVTVPTSPQMIGIDPFSPSDSILEPDLREPQPEPEPLISIPAPPEAPIAPEPEAQAAPILSISQVPMPEHDELTPEVTVTPITPATDTTPSPSDEMPSSTPEFAEPAMAHTPLLELPMTATAATAAAATEPAEPIPTVASMPEPPDTSAQDALILELQASLQEQMTKRAEADHRARVAEERTNDYDAIVADKCQVEQELDWMKDQLASLAQDKNSLEVELTKLREARDEFERKEILLSNRVNDAKKKEALKANLAEQLQAEVRSLQSQLSTTTTQWTDAVAAKAASDASQTAALAACTEKLQHAELALADERRLNDERKKKMKVFVESKSEELRQARAQADDYNLELSQTNRSMREHQARWKQLHAQWVQSQTRNRELQRELNKLQKDQETANRMGDKMEMQMAKSAQETTLHKTKRLTAKHELMTVLRTLDAERELSGKLRDSIKFSFTPKALSQQQLMKESLKDLERELVQLSRRLGRPLPPSPETAYSLDEEEEEGGEDGEAPGKKSRSEIDTEHLLSNLEEETQRVSQCIMTLGTSIERLHMVLSDSGERNCVGVLHDILSAASGSQTYGQVRTNDMS